MQLSWLPQGGLFGAAPTYATGAIFIGLGLLLLLFGWRTYRVSLVTIGVLIGGGIGTALAALVNLHPLLFALPLGILAGVAAVMMEKVGAFFIGGLVGAIPIIVLRAEFQSTAAFYAAAGLGFLIAGIMAIFLWKPVIVVFLSLLGAAFIANGLALTAERLSPGKAEAFVSDHPVLILAAVLLLAVLGVFFQTGGKEGMKSGHAAD
jgi:hypothetical protein